MKVRNTFAIFLVSGFWHGANWTFIIWGALNALFFLPLLLTNQNRKNIGIVAEGKYFPTVREFFSILLTFTVTVLAWVFFRAESVTHALHFLQGIFSWSLFSFPQIMPTKLIGFLAFFLLIEWLGREQQHAIAAFWKNRHRFLRYAFYYALIVAIIWFGGKEQEFIYFQF